MGKSHQFSYEPSLTTYNQPLQLICRDFLGSSHVQSSIG